MPRKRNIHLTDRRIKQCSKCRVVRPLEEFSKCKDSSDGRLAHCNYCKRQAARERAALRAATNSFIAVTEKQCKECGIVKPVDAFHVSHHAADGRKSACKPCRKVLTSRYNAQPYDERAANRLRVTRLKREFGLTIEQYEAMFIAQGGTCAICKRAETCAQKGKPLPLSVDHDHVTGEVRGLLCRKCNVGLGNFMDNSEYLTSAITYLSAGVVLEVGQ